MKRARLAQPRSTSRSGRVVVVDQAVVDVALELAGGDPTRLRVLSSTAVLVTNHGRKAQQRT